MDAKAASRHLLRTLFDRTAGACLQQMASALPEAEERARFQALFSPDALSDAFAEGVFQFSMDHWISTGKGGPSWVRTEAEMAENPDTLHLEVFFQLWDRSFPRLQSTLLDTLTRQDYELVLTADARSGACRAYGPSAGRLPENATCRSLARLVSPAAAALPPADRPAESPLPGGCLVPAGGSSLCGAGPPGPGRSALPSAVFPAGGDARACCW